MSERIECLMEFVSSCIKEMNVEDPIGMIPREVRDSIGLGQKKLDKNENLRISHNSSLRMDQAKYRGDCQGRLEKTVDSALEVYGQDCFGRLDGSLSIPTNMGVDYRPNITRSADDRNLDDLEQSTHHKLLSRNEQELRDDPTTFARQDDLATDPLEFEELRCAAYRDVCRREYMLFREN
jgi:hypothetical protein